MSSKRLGSCAILLLNLFVVESSMYLTDLASTIEIVANNKPCRVYNDTNFAKNLYHGDSSNVFEIPPKILREISDNCQDMYRMNKTGGFLFPGTKWCGPGRSARSYDDLGELADVDRCCREHDLCPNHLEAGQCKHGICNTSPYTRSHCDCDDTFRNCLSNLGNIAANIIGSLYFNIVQVTCFRERRDCTQSLRDNLSYSWFCEEWKFVPSKNFVPSLIEPINENHEPNTNEISDNRRLGPEEHSKIDRDLETIFGNDDEITKIMNDYKTLRD